MSLTFNPFTGTFDFTGSGGGSATIGGTIDTNQVAFGTALNTIGGSDNFRWDDDPNEVWLLIDPALTADRYTALGLFPTSTVDGSVLADTTFTVDPASDGFTYGGFIANTTVKSTNNKNIAFIDGFESHVNLDGIGGTITYAAANYLRVQGSGAATVTDAYLSQAGLAVAGTGSHVTHGYGYQIDAPAVDSAMTSYYAFRSEDIGTSATNGYYSWFDSRGVRRVREDTTFNSVGQAIEALYNPQFTKYTAGATNYERLILGQWESHVATITTEAGGTGTLRAMNLGDDGVPVQINGKAITLANSFTTSGNFALTLTQTGSTNVTLPTSGTLLTTTGSGASLTFPGTLSIASGKVLTASNTLTFTGTDSTSFAFPSTSDTVVALTATQTLTNKRITKRVTTASDATSITPNSDTADVTYQANTQAAGTLTINADAGTPTNGQSWVLKIKSTNVQTFSWNTIYVGGTVALPTATTGGAKIDYFVFMYDSVTPKWDYTGTAGGF